MSATYARERTLQDEIAPAVERGLPGVEVLAVELVSPSRFCVYVDHPNGVDHALCAQVTRLLDAYRSDFTIDVSSPGPERPLRKPEHFDGRDRTARRRPHRSRDRRAQPFQGGAASAPRTARHCSRRPGSPSRYASRTTPSCGRI